MKLNKLFEDVFMDIDWSLYDDETADLTGLEDKIYQDILGKNNTPKKYFPTSSMELQKIICELIEAGETNLNCIEVKDVLSLHHVFQNVNKHFASFPGWANRVVTLDVGEWDVSNVKDMIYAFHNVKNFNISGLWLWDVSNLKNAECAFKDCTSFVPKIDGWDVSNVKNMNFMLQGCKDFNLDLSKWDVSNVETMMFMFDGCVSFEGKGLEKWNISSLVEASYIFQHCTNFNGDLSRWNTCNLKKTSGMFNGCTNFNQDLSKWDVRNVEAMAYMFKDCKNFNCNLSKWDVRNVKDMDGLFFQCEKFTGFKLSEWKLDKLETMMNMFCFCYSFNCDLSNWNIGVINGKNTVFYKCTKLEENGLIPDWYKHK